MAEPPPDQVMVCSSDGALKVLFPTGEGAHQPFKLFDVVGAIAVQFMEWPPELSNEYRAIWYEYPTVRPLSVNFK